MFQNLKEFFAEARSEFKKISWPSVDEIKGSTAVVCVTIAFLMAVLAFYDLTILGVASQIQKIFK
jgi:preprotein translocase SecE subunit